MGTHIHLRHAECVAALITHRRSGRCWGSLLAQRNAHRRSGEELRLRTLCHDLIEAKDRGTDSHCLFRPPWCTVCVLLPRRRGELPPDRAEDKHTGLLTNPGFHPQTLQQRVSDFFVHTDFFLLVSLWMSSRPSTLFQAEMLLDCK